MLGEKTAILAYLKKLRASDPSRLWRLTGVAVGSAVSMAAAIAVVPGRTGLDLGSETVVEHLGTPTISIHRSDERPFIREGRVLSGETLGSALVRLGMSDTRLASQANTQSFIRQLAGAHSPGALITVATTATGELHSASIARQGSNIVHILEAYDGKLRVSSRTEQLEARIHLQGGVVRSSLFAAMDASGLPDSVAEDLSKIFGDDIDFHTDLRRGDRFSVIYEIYYYKGIPIRTGKIQAAEFINQGTRHSAYLFPHPDGSEDYYNEEGKSHKQGFLRSPLEFSRISSGFSMREHPIFGNWREHKGVDYAAPHGTAVKATSDGTIEFVGKQSGYGNFVVLRHRNAYTTAYGHLSHFAEGLKPGNQVSQGEVIGYVGSTGWATGPHLHYEFRINDVHQDPLTVRLPEAQALSGAALRSFREQISSLSIRLSQAQESKTAAID
ncbi:peptidoglycan DD-metalloendopeptidase family protein [Zoogloea sp.]|uniref:M23 family metallopeptidase n=1 Tax=Zoogloea sp. TaxID=49181 RepID=UPI0035B01696